MGQINLQKQRFVDPHQMIIWFNGLEISKAEWATFVRELPYREFLSFQKIGPFGQKVVNAFFELPDIERLAIMPDSLVVVKHTEASWLTLDIDSVALGLAGLPKGTQIEELPRQSGRGQQIWMGQEIDPSANLPTMEALDVLLGRFLEPELCLSEGQVNAGNLGTLNSEAVWLRTSSPADSDWNLIRQIMQQRGLKGGDPTSRE